MKLTIELVPETAWYNNMRKVLSIKDWDDLRHKVYRQYNHVCGVCGASGMMNCHEIWEYDDKQHIQHLKGFIALCTMCHHCKHIGYAEILADRGELDYDEVVRHFCKVNKCTREEFDNYLDEVFAQWEERSNHTWALDLGEYKNLVKGENHGP